MPHRRTVRLIVNALFVLLSLSSLAPAEVVRVQVDQREAFADGQSFGTAGPYERVRGRMFLEVDPAHPANVRVVDLALAPRNEREKVEFWTDFFLLKPVDS